MNTHKIDNGWLISYGKRRANAAKAQAHDLLLTSARSAAHDTTPRPVERLPFVTDNPAPTGNGFYWTHEESVFDGAGMKYFIRNKAGHALMAEDTEAKANETVALLNSPDKHAHIECPF